MNPTYLLYFLSNPIPRASVSIKALFNPRVLIVKEVGSYIAPAHHSLEDCDVDLGVFEEVDVVVELEHRLFDVVVGVDNLQRHRSDARQDAERRFAGVVRRHFDEGVVEADASCGAGDRLVVVGGVDQLQCDRDLQEAASFNLHKENLGEVIFC